MKVYLSPQMDPYLHLALEELIFEEVFPQLDGEFILLLWRNSSCVVVGQNQNIYQEINIGKAKQAALPLLRRMTGGGTVFHDEGNLNYSYLLRVSTDHRLDYDYYLEPLLRALDDFGLATELRNSSDVFLGGRKISGSAQRMKQGRLLHHGTLLCQSDLSLMRELLAPADLLIESVSVASRPSPVANIFDHGSLRLSDRSMDAFMPLFAERLVLALRRCFSMAGTESVDTLDLSEDLLERARLLARKKYGSESWTYDRGATCRMAKDICLAGTRGRLQVRLAKGQIAAVDFYKTVETDSAASNKLADDGLPRAGALALKKLRSALLGEPLYCCEDLLGLFWSDRPGVIE